MLATHVPSLGQEDRLEGRAQHPTPVFLPGESHGRKSLVGYSPWGRKESDRTEATEHTCQWKQVTNFKLVIFNNNYGPFPAKYYKKEN